MIRSSRLAPIALGLTLSAAWAQTPPAVTSTGSLPAPAATTPAAGPAGWQKPLPSAYAQPPSEGAEGTILAWVPGTGYVRGTREALETIGRPLVDAAGRNRIVEACRVAVEAEAVRLGAAQVEAASAGPERRSRDGTVAGPVDVRITYARSGGYEVRTSRLTCVVDREGRVVETAS
jgi:hypothetical protein